ncbi:MAG: hypothetical protein GY771_04075, partial [bacterium]|nr:hypothetical protein [bacterium]
MKRRDGKLKILFVTSGDPFFGRHFFAEFFRLFYKNKIDILGVIIQEPLGTSKIGAVKKTYGLYGFFGTIKLSILAFYLSIRGLIPKFVYKGRGGNYTLKQILSSEKIRIIGMGNINDDVSIRILKSLAPDIIISLSASQKFGAEVLSVPRVACLNGHSGELPRYRGMSTVFWMLYEGKGYTSPTIH